MTGINAIRWTQYVTLLLLLSILVCRLAANAQNTTTTTPSKPIARPNNSSRGDDDTTPETKLADLGTYPLYAKNPKGMPLFKLRQWSQSATDKSWCPTAKVPQNIGEAQEELLEEECSALEPRQYIHYWEVKEGARVYKLRFANAGLCLTAGNIPPSQPDPSLLSLEQDQQPEQQPEQQQQGQQQQQQQQDTPVNPAQTADVQPQQSVPLQRRALSTGSYATFNDKLGPSNHLVRRDASGQFNDKLESSSHSRRLRRRFLGELAGSFVPKPKDIALPDQNARIGSPVQGAPAIGVGMREMPTNPGAGTAPTEPTHAVNVGDDTMPITLAPCERLDSQLFQVRRIVMPFDQGDYFQLKSLPHQRCLASGGSDKSPVILAPCRSSDDPSQLWLLEESQRALSRLTDKHTVFEYASTFQIKNFEEKLGMSRQVPPLRLDTAVLDSVAAKQPGAEKQFEMVYELSTYIHAYIMGVYGYQTAHNTLVSSLVNIFYTQDEFPSLWDAIWGGLSMFLSFIPLPWVMIGVNVIESISQGVKEKSKAKKPGASDLLKWNSFMIEQADYVADGLFKSFSDMIKKTPVSELHKLLYDFKKGRYQISQQEFIKKYKTSLVQQLLHARPGDFWITVCEEREESSCGSPSGDRFKNHGQMEKRTKFYTTNVPKAGVEELQAFEEYNNFFDGKNGWLVERNYYTCRDGCKVRMVLESGAADYKIV